MTPERYRRVGQLFNEVLERPPGERAAFLDRSCGSQSGEDSAFRAEVERLLAHHDETFLDRPAMDVAAGLVTQTQFRAPVGKMINHYQIQAQLGIGGMGEVWLARDTVLERQVALKLLHAQFTRSPERLQRFMREARAVSALNHPNIITIHEIGEAAGAYFIATEFVDGITLRRRLEEGPTELPEALAIVKQIAEALDTAHQAGIIHRDIKPENVMLRRGGLVKVLDFGLASVSQPGSSEERAQGSPEALRLTDPGTVMGTPRYMSPEQARGLKVDARTDLFSLGVVFYELVTGRPPFPGGTAAEIFSALLGKEPPPLPPGLPAQLEEMLHRMLAKKPEERYETMRAFLTDLERLSLTPSLEVQSRIQTTPQWLQLRWFLPALILTTALGFGLYSWFSGRSVSPDRPAAEARFTPLIGEPGTKDFAVFSPDETRIAFAWDGGKNAQASPRDIYVKVIGTDGPPMKLTDSPENEAYPTWTPDGKYVTFVRLSARAWDEAIVNQVIRVPANGGPEQKLGETNTAASWSPDSKTLAVSLAPKAGGGIFALSLESGERTRLTQPPPGTQDNFPCFSPDGKWLAFTRDYSPTETDIFAVSTSGGAPKQVTSDRGRVLLGLTWTSDSREIVYAGNRASGRGVWRVAVSGGGPQRVPINGKDPLSPNISRQGNKLVWTEASSDSDIFQYQGPGFAGGVVPGQFGAGVKVASSSIHEDHSPQFSPDGHKLVFASGRTGGQELWVSDPDGSHAVRLTTKGGPTGSPRWSPDSKWIAFDSHVGGNGDIYVISVSGGPWRRLTFEPSAEVQPAWSSDGKWIYFKSNRTGKYQIHKMPAAGGPAKQITFQGGMEGFEAPDGSSFYYTKTRGEYGIYSVPANGGEEKLVPELRQAGYWRSWGVVRQGIYFLSKESGLRQTVRFFSFATRRVTPMLTVDTEALWLQPGLALSSDGRRLMFAQLEHANDEIMLMENFR